MKIVRNRSTILKGFYKKWSKTFLPSRPRTAKWFNNNVHMTGFRNLMIT